MFSEAEVHQIEDVIYNVLKHENILQKKTGQTVLPVETEISIEECDEEYMKDKSIACWWFSNNDGKSQNVKHDMLFIFGNGKFTGRTTTVLKTLPFTFEEAYKVWESHIDEGKPLSEVYSSIPFQYSPAMSDLYFIVWAVKNGKCDWMLKGTRDDRYDFDFKKYIGMSK